MSDKLAEINERIERRRRENGEERRGIKEEVNTETNEDGVYRATIWLDDIEAEEEEREVKFQLPEEFSLNAEAQERLEAVKVNETEENSNRPVEDNVDSFPEVQAVIKNEDDPFEVFQEDDEVEIEEWEPEFEKKYTIIELSSDSEEENQEESGSDKEEEKENENDNDKEDDEKVEENDKQEEEDKEDENDKENEGVPEEACTWDCIHAHQNELFRAALAAISNRVTILEDLLQVKNGARFQQFLKTRQYLLDIGFGESDPVTNGKRSERSREVVELLQLIYTAEDEARSNADGKSSTVRSGPASVVVTVEEKGSQPSETSVEAPRKPKQKTAQTQTPSSKDPSKTPTRRDSYSPGQFPEKASTSPRKDPSKTPTRRFSCSPHQSSEKASTSSPKDQSRTPTRRDSSSPRQSSEKASTSSHKDPSRTPTRKGSFSPRQSSEKASISQKETESQAQSHSKTKKPKQSTHISTKQRTPSPKPKKFPRFKKKTASPTPKPTTPSTQYAVTSSILAPPSTSEKPSTSWTAKPTASSSTTQRKRIPSSSLHEKTLPKQAVALTTTPVKTSILTPTSAKANTPSLPSTSAQPTTAAPKWTLSADGKPIRGNKHSASASSSHALHPPKRPKLSKNLLNLDPDEDEGSYATIEYKICPLCSEVIKLKNLQDHLIQDHEQDHIKVKCPGTNCGEEFQTRKLYRNHMTAKHNLNGPKHPPAPGFDFFTFKKAEEPVLNWLKGLYKSAPKPSISAVNEARLKQRKLRQNQITTVITSRSPPVRLKSVPSSSQGTSRSPLLPTPLSPAILSRPPPPIVPPFLQTQNIQIPFDPRIPPPPTPPRVPFQESSNPFLTPNHNPFMQESIRPPKYSRFN